MLEMMKKAQVNPQSFGWASVQLDGGIDSVTEKVIHWFEDKLSVVQQQRQSSTNSTTTTAARPQQRVDVGLDQLRVGIITPPHLEISPKLAR